MRSSGSERKHGRHARCLIVDGYNVLPQLFQKSLRDIGDLESARRQLIDQLAEYGAFRGEAIVIVFDAHQTDEPARHFRQSRSRSDFHAEK